MPLHKSECVRLFGREPKNELEARKFALWLRKNKRDVRFDNIQAITDKIGTEEKFERKKRMESEIVKIEMNKVMMKNGSDYPTMKECIEAAIANGSALVEREITDKDELNLKFNIIGKRSKVDRDGQNAALEKIVSIMEVLGIDDSTKITFSDQ